MSKSGDNGDDCICPTNPTTEDRYILFHTTDDQRYVISYSGSDQVSNPIVVFNYESQNLFHCKIGAPAGGATPPTGCVTGTPANYACHVLTHKKLGEVEEDEEDLFIALIGAGQVFFEHSADEGQESAFALGHALLKKACNAGSATSKAQCVAGFYCFLQGQSGISHIDQDDWFNDKDVKDKLDETVDLRGCAYDTSFTAL